MFFSWTVNTLTWVTSPPRWFPSSPLLTLLLYLIFIFYITRIPMPDFPSLFSQVSLPFLSCCHRTTKTIQSFCNTHDFSRAIIKRNWCTVAGIQEPYFENSSKFCIHWTYLEHLDRTMIIVAKQLRQCFLIARYSDSISCQNIPCYKLSRA